MARRVFAREIYFYIICIIAIVIFVIGVVNLVDSAVNYIHPTTYMTKSSVLPSFKDQYKDMSQEEIDKLVNDEIAAQENIEKLNGLKGIIRGALLIIIAVPLFATHWKMAQNMWKLSLESEKD
jgi:hypothetical protein